MKTPKEEAEEIKKNFGDNAIIHVVGIIQLLLHIHKSLPESNTIADAIKKWNEVLTELKQ